MNNRPLRQALALSAAMLPFAATAAPLHWPLPAGSTAVNGEVQPLRSHHVGGQPRAVPPLPAAQPITRAAPYSGTPVDVLNYHYDTYPTGWNRAETDLTASSVASPKFAKLGTVAVDGNVFAQPLLVAGYTMPDGSKHDVLVVATGHDSVYAFDASSGAKLWQVSLGTPQATADVGCTDVQPEYGISSTPVIVRNGGTATIYVVAATEPAPLSFHTQLHALDLGTGRDTVPATEIDPQAALQGGGILHFDPQNQWNRASLVYSQGSIYVGVGSHCDNNAGNISGWLLRYNAADLSLASAFNTIQAKAGYELASIWMSGYAPAIDDQGNVLAVTGNGNFSLSPTAPGYGESVISLDSAVSRINGAFTPAHWRHLNGGDADFGSGGVMAIPVQDGQKGPPLAVAAGKQGFAYLMDASALGGNGAAFGSAYLQTVQVGGCWCGPAYYVGPSGGVLYYQGSNDVLRAFAVRTGTKPRLALAGTSSDAGGFGGSFPVISSNGATQGTGVVWVLKHGTTMTLEAYDAEKLGAPLFTASAGTWSNGSRGYLTPLVANGRVYAPAYGSITVFGLTK
jgi:hypothetical protein